MGFQSKTDEPKDRSLADHARGVGEAIATAGLFLSAAALVTATVVVGATARVRDTPALDTARCECGRRAIVTAAEQPCRSCGRRLRP